MSECCAQDFWKDESSYLMQFSIIKNNTVKGTTKIGETTAECYWLHMLGLNTAANLPTLCPTSGVANGTTVKSVINDAKPAKLTKGAPKVAVFAEPGKCTHGDVHSRTTCSSKYPDWKEDELCREYPSLCDPPLFE